MIKKWYAVLESYAYSFHLMRIIHLKKKPRMGNQEESNTN